jgi:hypothetical protein
MRGCLACSPAGRSRTLKGLWGESIESRVHVCVSALCFVFRNDGEETIEDFPVLAEALVVDYINDVDDCTGVIVVFGPDGPDPALACES